MKKKKKKRKKKSRSQGGGCLIYRLEVAGWRARRCATSRSNFDFHQRIMNRYANPRTRIITHSCDIVFSHAVNRGQARESKADTTPTLLAPDSHRHPDNKHPTPNPQQITTACVFVRIICHGSNPAFLYTEWREKCRQTREKNPIVSTDRLYLRRFRSIRSTRESFVRSDRDSSFFFFFFRG